MIRSGARRLRSAGLAAALAAASAAGVDSAPDLGQGIYCRTLPGTGSFLTVMLAPPDASGLRRLRIEDHVAVRRARAPRALGVHCRQQGGQFVCRWGAGGAVELALEPVTRLESGYLLMEGRLQDLPRDGTEALRCYVKPG